MAKKSSSQHFITRNRAPRVHIVYEPEVGDANRKIDLPFVMGVMADLSGKNNDQLKDIPNRSFTEIDNDSFDRVLKAAKPRVAFTVPNRVGGQGNLAIDLAFEKLEDFTPAQVAKNVEPLAKLLEFRTQLANLLTWMDGKPDAENFVAGLLKDENALKERLAALSGKDGGREETA
jgi:type VI secretion system protein ImpB